MDKLYKEAAQILKKLEGRHGSVKSLVFNTSKTCTMKKKLFALVINTVKKKAVILRVMEECSLLAKEPKLNRHLCMVLVYDLLFGKGIQCGGPFKRLLMNNKSDLKAALTLASTTVDNYRDSGISLPKYARVNLLKVSIAEAISLLESEGYSLVTSEEFLEHLKHCSLSRQPGRAHRHSPHQLFCQDTLLDYVFVFCPCSLLISTALYAHSQLILQDKASCLPAHLLAPPAGSVVIDACAAPGNKTTHLASILNNSGTIHAFDKDEQRYSVLTEMVEKAGASCVTTHCQDFLKMMPTNFPEVEYILVDPSCSGSGIVSRIDYDTTEISRQRLKSLSLFQRRILKHALSFPNVKRVVYSTCSVHSMENEVVVQHALSHFKETFDLVNILPDWKRRGEASFSKGSYCIHLNREDLTNGFFVAVFERLLVSREHQEVSTPPSKKPKLVCRGKRKRKGQSRHVPVTGV